MGRARRAPRTVLRNAFGLADIREQGPTAPPGRKASRSPYGRNCRIHWQSNAPLPRPAARDPFRHPPRHRHRCEVSPAGPYQCRTFNCVMNPCESGAMIFGLGQDPFDTVEWFGSQRPPRVFGSRSAKAASAGCRPARSRPCRLPTGSMNPASGSAGSEPARRLAGRRAPLPHPAPGHRLQPLSTGKAEIAARGFRPALGRDRLPPCQVKAPARQGKAELAARIALSQDTARCSCFVHR